MRDRLTERRLGLEMTGARRKASPTAARSSSDPYEANVRFFRVIAQTIDVPFDTLGR